MIISVLLDHSLSSSDKLSLIIPQIIAVLIILFLILPLHELAHGWVAYKFGDRTAKNAGILTFNPLVSIDPWGALMILLFGFGWARPVPVNPNNFKNPRVGMAVTAAAGPISNFLAALIGAFIYVAVLVGSGFSVSQLSFGMELLWTFIAINISLAVFNLIPIPPLDGSKILASFLPQRLMEQFYRYQGVFILVLYALMFTGALSGPLSYIQNACAEGILWLAQLPFHLSGAL